MGGVRQNHDPGQCPDDPGHLSHEASQAFQSVRLGGENKESTSMISRSTQTMWLVVAAGLLGASLAAKSVEAEQGGPHRRSV
jgi:hypothetical protein